MTKTDEVERIERAKRLRRQIDDLTRSKREEVATDEKETPAAFVHRRMQEMERSEKNRSN